MPEIRLSTEDFEKAIEDQAMDGRRYLLRLYVTGTTPRSARAIQNIRSICEAHLPGRYELEIIDVYQQPALAQGAQIIAAPTLVKREPEPARRIVGDLSNPDRVLVGLDLYRAD